MTCSRASNSATKRYSNQNFSRNRYRATAGATATSGYDRVHAPDRIRLQQCAGDYLMSTQATSPPSSANDLRRLFERHDRRSAPHLKLVGGLRYDRYEATISNSFNSTNVPGNTRSLR